MVQPLHETPDEVESASRTVAAKTNRSIEDVLRAWMKPLPGEVAVDSLSDDEVTKLSNLPTEMAQTELNKILERSKGSPQERYIQEQYAELIDFWGCGLFRKSEARKIAIQRGLIPP